MTAITIDADVTLHVRITMPKLNIEDETTFAERCMAQQGNCDNDWTHEQNHAWFAEIWRQQISFQQACFADPDLLAGLVAYLALTPLSGTGWDSNYLVPHLPAVETMAEPVAVAIGQEAHFFPPAEYGVDTYSMLSDVLDQSTVGLRQAPTVNNIFLEMADH